MNSIKFKILSPVLLLVFMACAASSAEESEKKASETYKSATYKDVLSGQYKFAVPAMPGELDVVEAKNYNPELDKDVIYKSAFGRADDIKILLGHGGNPNAKNRMGWSALAIATDRKDTEALSVVKVLVEAGAKIDEADLDKNYPILNAVKNHQTEIVSYLISKKASIGVTDSSGNSLVDIAKLNRYKEVEDILDKRIKEVEAEISAKKSRENLSKMAKESLISACLGQFNEYVGTRDARLNEDERKARVEAAKRYKSLAKLRADELIDLFEFNKDELQYMVEKTNSRLVESLDFLGARKSESSYGTQKFMEKKCGDLVDLWKIKSPAEVNAAKKNRR